MRYRIFFLPETPAFEELDKNVSEWAQSLDSASREKIHSHEPSTTSGQLTALNFRVTDTWGEFSRQHQYAGRERLYREGRTDDTPEPELSCSLFKAIRMGLDILFVRPPSFPLLAGGCLATRTLLMQNPYYSRSSIHLSGIYCLAVQLQGVNNLPL